MGNHRLKFLEHHAKDGTTIYYSVTFGYIAVIVTIIMLLLVKEFGWIW